MKLRQLIIFAALPLILALCILAYTVQHHAADLGRAQREVIQQAYLAGKETELKSYVMLARHSIAPLYESGRADNATTGEAKAILARLDYGDDGYFFVYDLHGKLLVHSRKPELIGQNRLGYRDLNGFPTIQQLISRAREGGGIVKYATEKPSTGKPTLKLTYVSPLPRWGWVLGTGIYLDDVDDVLAKVDAQIGTNNFDTMRGIGAVALFGIAVVIASALVLTIRERRLAKTEERARIASELHDDICQRLVSARLQTETGIIQMSEMPEGLVSAEGTFRRMSAELNNIQDDVRRIAHDLNPLAICRGFDAGLAVPLRRLCHEMEDGAIRIEFSVTGQTDGLSIFAMNALNRVAQESLRNAREHGAANLISVRLEGCKHIVKLTVEDNGRGFDVSGISDVSPHGMGLRNMKHRVEEAGGNLRITSSGSGTTVIATVRRSSLLHHFLPNS